MESERHLTDARRYSDSAAIELSLARVEAELGKFWNASQRLYALAGRFDQKQFAFDNREPFLCAIAAYEQQPWNGEDPKFVLSMALEGYLSYSHFSTFYVASQSLSMLERLTSLGHATDEARRRFSLARMQLGLAALPERGSEVLNVGPQRNAWLWQSAA